MDEQAPVRFARETLASARAGHTDVVLLRHWAEITHYRDIPLNIDWERYELAEQLGKLRSYTARVDGQLIGYIAFFVDHNVRYRDSLQAVQDVLYLLPEYRCRPRVGLRLIAFCDLELASEGVQVARHHQKIAHPALGRLLEISGYEREEVLWAKRLDRSR